MGRRKVSKLLGLEDDCGVLEFAPWGSDLAVGWDLFLGVSKGGRWHCPMLGWMAGCCMSMISTPAETLNSSSQPLTT